MKGKPCKEHSVKKNNKMDNKNLEKINNDIAKLKFGRKSNTTLSRRRNISLPPFLSNKGK